MTTYLGKSCSFCLPRVPFVNCRQFMYLVISLLVLRAGYGIWLYQFLIIAYLFILCNEVPFKKMSHCMIKIMSWTESILRPIQQYFSHIRTMVGKYNWFCEMRCCSGSGRITRVFWSWERYFCVQETAHNQSKKISNDQELIQPDPTSCSKNQKGNN